MISYSCILKYRELYPNDYCAYSEPSDNVLVSNKKTGNSFISSHEETDEIFLDRIERSKKTGENLFYKEWTRFEYKKDLIY